MSRKLDLVNDAYSLLRISGLTVDPSPSDLQLALYRMERMMAELYEQRGLNVDYNFQETPALSQQSGLSWGTFPMVAAQTAIRLCPDFGKSASAELVAMASAGLSGALGQSVMRNMREQQPPRRMPAGNGNSFGWMVWTRYMQPVANAPVGAATNYILQGETLDYREDFTAWLGTATIASYTITVDPLLTLVSDSEADGVISYRLTAPTDPVQTSGPYQLVLIEVTDSSGRVELRLINFEVTTPPDVGSDV
jgi:hypothetical protein